MAKEKGVKKLFLILIFILFSSLLVGIAKSETTNYIKVTEPESNLIKNLVKEVKPESALPPTPKNTYTTSHFTVNYDLCTGGSGDTIDCVSQAFAQKVGNYLESAWTKEVSNLGFLQPPDTKIDVYIEYSYLYGGYLEYVNSQINIYINSLLDPDNSCSDSNCVTSLDNALKFTTAHEFFHAIQLNYDITDSKWILEGTANLIADKVYDSLNYYFEYLNYSEYTPPLKYPDTSLNDASDLAHAYSAVLFFKFMEEHYGTNGAGKKCYQDCANSNCGVDIIKVILDKTKNYNDIEAVRQALATKAETFENAFLDYLTANYAKDLGNPFMNGFYDYCEDEEQAYEVNVWVTGYPHQVLTYSSSLNNNALLNIPNDGVLPWANDYAKISLASNIGKLTISFDGQNPPSKDFLLRYLFMNGSGMEIININTDSSNNAILEKNNNAYSFLNLIVAGKNYGGSYILKINSSDSTTSCNNNYKCESGETNANCPNDCNNLALASFNVPNNATIGSKFNIKCDYNQAWLPCITAKHGNNYCNYVNFEGTKAVFECTAVQAGNIDNYCELFDNHLADSRCKGTKQDKINSTNVTPGSCNNNYKCELGETSQSCPNDCNNLALGDFNVPNQVIIGSKFNIKCDYNQAWLPCMTAKHGNNYCTYKNWEGTKAVFECTATQAGNIDNYCELFDNHLADSRCKGTKQDKINNTDVDINLTSFYAPSTAAYLSSFNIKCNYNVLYLPCISAKHGSNYCSFFGWEGNAAVFNCIASQKGTINNYCEIFNNPADSRCYGSQSLQILSTYVS